MRSIVLAFFFMLVGCAGEPPAPTYDIVAERLSGMPTGDADWRLAYNLARADKRQDELERLSATLAEEHPDRWEPVWTRGKCVRDGGDPELALELFDRAYQMADAWNDDVGLASAANDAGWMRYLAGELSEGKRWYDLGILSAQRAGREDLEAFLRNNLAGLHVRALDFTAARAEQERAETALRAIGRNSAAERVKRNRAIILLELGDALAAEDLLVELYEAAVTADNRGMIDKCAIVLGNLQLTLGRTTDAGIWYARVSDDDPYLAVSRALGLGRAALMEGKFAEAARVLSAGATRCRPIDVGRALILETWAATATGQRVDLERVIAEADALGAEEPRWLARAKLGRLLLQLDRVDEAIPVLEQAVALAEAQSSPLDSAGEGLHYLRERSEPYVDLALALSRQGQDSVERILQVAGRVQARALGTADDAVRLGAIQRGLSPGQLLLVYLIGDESGIVVVVEHDAARTVPVAGRRSLLKDLQRYRDALSSDVAVVAADTSLPPDVRGAGARIVEGLIGPIESSILAAQRLYVVADQELALLPLSSLPFGERGFLGDLVEIALLPRPGVPPMWEGARGPVLLAGQPQLQPGSEFGELPWAAYELSKLRKLWGEEQSTYVAASDFSLAGLERTGLDNFSIVHMATHAVASTRDPRRCGIILSNGERMGIEQITRLELPSSLVVLSACRTGEGELLPGQGVIGLSWAFLQAGARGVVASRWTVDDVAAARLMVAFHRHLKDGADPVRALSRARREIALESPHPALWAPFDIVLRPGQTR